MPYNRRRFQYPGGPLGSISNKSRDPKTLYKSKEKLVFYKISQQMAFCLIPLVIKIEIMS